ncbi:MAG: 6-phosphogluconolactonase [Rhizobiaceae bacterium]|nr:6-phosphogluconolactonase [Rhizobiaceae bacterium]
MEINVFDDREMLANALADQIAGELKMGLGLNGKASLAVSGGSTPVLFFKTSSKRDLDWANVTITLVDERWVDDSQDRSNAKLVKDFLLKNKAAAANFQPLYQEGMEPEEAIATIEEAVIPLLPFDAVVLGMGEDGHTASFFPSGDKLEAATDINANAIISTMQAKAAGEVRVTLTLAAILIANFLAVHLEGGKKQQVMERAMDGSEPASDLPIRHILRNYKDVELFWSK